MFEKCCCFFSMATLGWISVLQIFSVGAVLSSPCSVTQYVGCYHLLRLPQAEHPSLRLKICTCMHHCSQLNSSYAAYKTPLCHCVFNLTQLRTVDEDSCTFSCVEDPSLRCGGRTAASLYSTGLLDLSATMDPSDTSSSDLPWLVAVAVVVFIMAIIVASFLSWRWKTR